MAFIERDGGHVFYDVLGPESGAANLIFLHGGGGNATTWWQQIEHFSKDYRICVIDNRGFGRSHPVNEYGMNINLFPDDVLAVADAAGMNEFGLVCQSLGAWTGLRLVRQVPDRIWAFVGCSSPMGIDYPKAIEDAMTFALSLAEKGEGIEDAALSETFRKDNPNGFYLYRHLNMFNLAVVRGADFGVTPQMLLGSMFGPDNQIPPSDLTAIKTPVLILGGSKDRLVTPETTTAIAGFFPEAKLHIFDGSGHSPYFEMPDAFNRLVGDWLAKQL